MKALEVPVDRLKPFFLGLDFVLIVYFFVQFFLYGTLIEVPVLPGLQDFRFLYLPILAFFSLLSSGSFLTKQTENENVCLFVCLFFSNLKKRTDECANDACTGRNREEEHKPRAMAGVRWAAGELAAGWDPRHLLPSRPQRAGSFSC